VAAEGVGSAPTSDVVKLFRLYRAPEPALDAPAAPPLSVLRHPRVIEVLLRGLFNPGRQLQAEAHTAHVALLSLATAALEEEAQEAGGGAAAVAALLEQPAAAATRAALETAAEVAHKALRDEQLSGGERGAFEAAADQPCAALGVLGMLRSRLTSAQYWTTAYHVHSEPPFLALLSSIAARQPALHADVLSLIADALAAMGHTPSGPDVARGLLDVALQLAAAGRVDEVLSWAERWARNADSGLVRHFVFGLLQLAAPPYSPLFAAAALRLAGAGGMRRQRVGGREWAARVPLLTEFAQACSAPAVAQALPQAEAATLRELLINLKPS
jgi:negative elongation factor C/D